MVHVRALASAPSAGPGPLDVCFCVYVCMCVCRICIGRTKVKRMTGPDRIGPTLQPSLLHQANVVVVNVVTFNSAPGA